MIRELFKIERFARLYDTHVSIGLNKKGVVSKNRYKTYLIHKEYGHNTKAWARSDIVIFDEKDVPKINDPINLVYNKEYLTPQFIFEFGSEKAAGSKKIFEKHLKQDIEKVSISKEEGFVIHVHRWFARATKRSMRYRANRIKKDTYRETVRTICAAVRKSHPNVKIIVAMIDIGTPKRNIGHKVELFDAHAVSWNAINLKDVKSSVYRLLHR
jgi:hypothetical protein